MTRGEALEILGLDSDASLDEAREAYRTLAKTYHPDKNSASNATAMFRIISDAWEVIQNTAAQEHSEAEIRQQQAEAEAARRRDAEEAARRHAEAAAEQKRAEAARQQAEKIHKQEKEREKKIKRYCYFFWLGVVTVHNIRESWEKRIKRYCYFFWGIPIGLVLIGDLNFRIQTDTIDFSFAMWAIIYGMAIPFSGWLNGWTIIQIRRSNMRPFYLFFGVVYYVSGLFLLLSAIIDRTLLFSQILMLFAFFVFAMPMGVFVVWFFRGMILKLEGR